MPFLDEYLSGQVPGFPCVSSPMTKTTIQVSASGRERRNQEWEHPLHRFILPEAVARRWEVVEDLKKHWLVMSGPFRSWPWRDPLDFASCDLVKPNQVPTVGMADQALGIGDGFTDSFQLKKTYAVGAESYEREIHLPVLSTLLVALDGVLVSASDYTVSRPGGVVTFDAPPLAPYVGHPQIITAGFLFDVEVRFEADDQLEGILRAHRAGGFADINLVEVRPC